MIRTFLCLCSMYALHLAAVAFQITGHNVCESHIPLPLQQLCSSPKRLLLSRSEFTENVHMCFVSRTSLCLFSMYTLHSTDIAETTTSTACPKKSSVACSASWSFPRRPGCTTYVLSKYLTPVHEVLSMRHCDRSYICASKARSSLSDALPEEGVAALPEDVLPAARPEVEQPAPMPELAQSQPVFQETPGVSAAPELTPASQEAMPIQHDMPAAPQGAMSH